MIKKYKNFINENQLSIFDSESTKPNFKNFSKRNYKIVNKIENLKDFIIYDLGIKDIIDKKIEKLSSPKDVNDYYQIPLEILNLTGKYPEITYTNGRWECEKMKSVNQVIDKDGKYNPVNKLNTNYSDQAYLLYDIIKALGKEDEIINLEGDELKKWLLDFVKVNDIEYFIKNNIDIEKYTYNNRKRSEVGDKTEKFVCEYLENMDFELLYQGGDGNFIDMIFGVDLIMKYKDRALTFQIKNNENDAIEAIKKSYYKRIDYFCSPKSVTELDESGFEKVVKKIIVFSKKNPEGKIV
jgi:hypothetical protein